MTTATTMRELPKSYVPSEHEAMIRRRWEGAGVFHAVPDADDGDAEAYCIVIPPPNVTAALHLGHAFNNALQDVLIRFNRMRGRNTLWMPGTDHAGIATQTVVEKRLLAEGVKRREMGRDAFVARVQEWRTEYEATITEQLKAIGASCDWERQRFTMDEMCADAVHEAFFRLFGDGLIERGKRLVNWDPATLTALADDEVEMEEVEGLFYYLRYPLVDDDGNDTSDSVTVATTRPETMLGDTAIGVSPSDPERAPLIGRRVRLPIVDRIVPIIGDDYVVIPDAESSDPKARYASGFLKVTPGHDPNDWLIGLRHDLPVINVMAPDASISDEHGWDDCSAEARQFVGMSREDARQAVTDWFEAHGLLAETRPYTHSVGFSYRSHVAIEPYLSDQWFVRVTDDRLVGEAQRAQATSQHEGGAPQRESGATRTGDGGLTFHPPRYARTYQAWHDNLRDWCISRQLWWGHRIPVWTTPEDKPVGPAAAGDLLTKLEAWEQDGRVARRPRQIDVESEGEAGPLDTSYWCLRDPDDREIAEPMEAGGLTQDPDVLDTWFSSGLWPISTMGWPDPTKYPDTVGLLETFNPTSVLVTGRDIITLWVSRMVMFTRYFREGDLPFRNVYINPLIQDGHGQTMSKSLGNGVDPRDIIDSHGADALRFTLVQMATATQDVRMPVDTLCASCEKPFHPKETRSPGGHRVAAPRQKCPECGAKLLSAYGLASGQAPGADEKLARNTSSKFDRGRNFANKVWNATRFALGNLDPATADPTLPLDRLGLVDRWIVNALHRTVHECEDALAGYQFSAYATAMESFIWRELCDWYLEAIKPTVQDDPAQQQVLRTVLDATLRLLHPICPFVTEALWDAVRSAGPAGLDGVELPPSDLLAAARWPDVACRVHDEPSSAAFERVRSLVTAVRGLRTLLQVPRNRTITLTVPENVATLVALAGGIVESLCGVSEIRTSSAPASGPGRADGTIPVPFEGEEILLGGVVEQLDLGAERGRLAKLTEEKERAVSGYRKKLANRGYTDKAPPEVVEETRTLAAKAESDLAATRRALEALEAADG